MDQSDDHQQTSDVLQSNDRNDSAISGEDLPAEGNRQKFRFVETVFVFLVFFLFAGSPAPDVNEAHYLAKAKYYWNPNWCPGDQFLASKDAHLVFNWTIGWLTVYFSLPVVAWIGRVLTWSLLAFSWQRMSTAILPKSLVSILTAGLFLLFLQRFHLAGEWVVGGVEAKGLAFVCLFLGLEAIVRGNWPRTWLWLGAATCFHVLVGGWSIVAAGIAWLFAGRDRPRTVESIPWVAISVVLALPGLLPALALQTGIDTETVREANRIYTLERLSHHLAPHTFPPSYVPLPRLFGEGLGFLCANVAILRNVLLVVVWCVFAWWMRHCDKQRRLNQFVCGAALIAALGVGIDLIASFQPSIGAALLRYYWFRLSDVAIPIGIAFALVGLIFQLERTRPVGANWSLVVIVLVALGNLLSVVYDRRSAPWPGADRQTLLLMAADPQSGMFEYHAAVARHSEWLSVCSWIAANTEPSERVLTPPNQQTFKWYAGRSEVATWKDVPQDAAALVRWRARFHEVYPADVRIFGLLKHSDRRLYELTKKYNASYLLIDRSRHDRPVNPRYFTLRYPTRFETNSTYSLYWVNPPLN